MAEPEWLTVRIVELIHDEQLAEHGGRRGTRDSGALESAVARPRQLSAYEAGSSITRLAAALCHGLVQGHPFVDGNKRIGFLAAYTFLYLNGLQLTASEPDVVATFFSVADGSMDEAGLATWLDAHAERVL